MRLSIILPVLNEAAGIAAALRRLQAQAPAAERIVVDGGSTDSTPEIARPLAAVMTSPRGRAQQMNTGAAVAQGGWLLFLHADTALPDGFERWISAAEHGGCAAGAFRLRIVGRHPLLPLLAIAANWRTRLRGIALGDQALFIRRDLFQRLGGFPVLPLMEDYAFMLRMRAEGVPLFLAGAAVTTSGRRWDVHGFWRTWWTMRRAYWRFDRTGSAAGLTARYPDVR
jgi:rSAM/selenodomain-associated transferase 2